MSAIISDIKDDLQKLDELKRKIAEVKHELLSIDIRIEVDRKNNLEGELKSLNAEYRKMVKVLSQVEGEILSAQKVLEGLTSKMIDQKDVVKSLEAEVKRLGRAYRSAVKKSNAGDNELANYSAARKALEEEKTALFALTQEMAKASLRAKQLRDDYNSYRNSAKGATEASIGIADALSSIKRLAGSAIAGFGIQQLVSDVIRVRGEFQKADMAIQTMLGSKEKADKLLGQVREYAKISPLEFGDITKATQMMLGFNIEASKIPGFIKAIGDVSMGESGRFNSLTLAFSQMSATGKLMGQDLNQMINAGFNPLSIIAEKTGKSIGQLKEEMSKGAVTTEMVQQAFIDATSAGGKFFGMSENGAKTIDGQLSMMSDAMDAALNNIGKDSEGIIVNSIAGVTKLIENYEQVGRVLSGLVVTYGSYRTAVALVTFAENGHTLAMTLARTQILLTQKAQALLNATMLANPYVLAAAALGTLLGVLVATSDTMDASDVATKNFNDAIEEHKKVIKKDREEIDKHIAILKDETETQGKRKEAYEGIMAIYPALESKYKSEGDIVKQLTQFYKDLNAEIAKKEGLQAQQRYDEVKQRAEDLKRLKELSDKGADRLKGSEKDEYKKLYRKYEKEIKKNQAWYGTVSGSISDLSQIADKEYQKNIKANRERQVQERANRYENIDKDKALAEKKRLEDAVKKAKAAGKKYLSLDGEEAISIEQVGKYIDTLDKNAAKVRKKGSDLLKDAKDAAKAARKAAKDLENSKKLYTEEEYKKKIKDANAAIQAADTNVKSLEIQDKAGRTEEEKAKKHAEALRKLAELSEKQKRDQSRKAEDLELSTREAEIKAMKDGTDKTIAQIELDRDRELVAIRRSSEDMRLARIEAAKKIWEADPKNKDKDFFKSTTYTNGNWGNTDSEIKNIEARTQAAEYKRSEAIKKEQQQQQQALLDYIKAYGSIQQQKFAINQEYNKKIEDSDSEAKKEILRRELEDKLSDLNLKQLQADVDWEKVFGDLDRLSTDALKTLKEKLRSALDAKDITVENAKILAEKINELEDKIVSRTDAWASFLPLLRERKRLEEEAARAAEDYQKAVEKTKEAEGKQQGLREKATHAIETYGKGSAPEEMTAESLKEFIAGLDEGSELYKELLSILQRMKVADEDLISAIDEEATARNKSVNATKNAKEYSFLGKALKDGMSSAGGTIQYGLGQLNELPELVDAIGLHDTEFGQGVEEFVGGVSHFSRALSKLQSGDFIGAAVDTVKGFADIGHLVERIGGFSFNGGNEEEVRAKDEELITANDRLRVSINALCEEMKRSSGADAIEKALEAVSQQEIYNKNVLERWANDMGYHSAHHSNASTWDLEDSTQESVNRALAQYAKENGKTAKQINVDNWWEFMELTPEEMDYIRKHAQDAWADITTEGKYEWVHDTLNEYADLAGKIEEMTAELYENLTQTSSQGVFDDFLNDLYNLADGVDDVTGDIEKRWQEMMNHMVVKNLVGSFQQTDLDEWYKKLAELQKKAAEAKKAGNFDAEAYRREMASLKSEYDALIEKGRQDIEDLKDAGIINETEGSSKNDKATFNSAKNITYEQADSLVGIQTAQQIAIEQGNVVREGVLQGVTVLNATAADLKSMQASNNLVISDIQSILVSSYLEHQEANEHLTNIEKAIIPIRSEIENIRRIVQEN